MLPGRTCTGVCAVTWSYLYRCVSCYLVSPVQVCLVLPGRTCTAVSQESLAPVLCESDELKWNLSVPPWWGLGGLQPDRLEGRGEGPGRGEEPGGLKPDRLEGRGEEIGRAHV